MKRRLQKIATCMGFRGLKSFSDMYQGGTLNAFGRTDCSFTILSVQLTMDNKVRGIEQNSTYFNKVTPQIKTFNKFVNDNGGSVDIDTAIAFAQSIDKFGNVNQ